MNPTIEISKNYKQTVELTEKLVSKVNDYVNLSIQMFAFPNFKVKLTAQNIVDILMDREDDPILTAVIVPSSFFCEHSITDFVKSFFIHSTITEGKVKWISPIEIVEVAEKIS